MADIIHIIDRSTPLDMLRQLHFLAAPDEQIICLGPPPEHWDATRASIHGQDGRGAHGHDARATNALPIRQVHCPLGSQQLAGLALRPLVESARVIHCWSIPAARALPYMGPLAAKVLSLPTAGGKEDSAALAESFVGADLHLTVPTHASAQSLVKAGLPHSYAHVVTPVAQAAGVMAVEERKWGQATFSPTTTTRKSTQSPFSGATPKRRCCCLGVLT
jgi:hypothetical protein